MTAKPMIEVGEALWLVDGPNVDFFGFPYPTRTLIAELAGRLWVWSPIPLTPQLRAQVDALGEVAWLVSPNKIHHLFLGEWAQAYPRAQLCGLAQVARRRDDLEFSVLLDDGPPPSWAGEIDQVVVRGSVVMEEVVFFHRRSRAAIFADLIENFEQEFLDAHWKRWQAPLARFAGIRAPDGQAPIDYRTSFLRRKPAREAIATIRGWAPQRVIMAHGRWIDARADAFLEHAFAWLD